jgi:hypothetical protein
MSEIITGTVGAVLGAGVTVVGTRWVSSSLDRKHESRRLMAAIGLVRSELEENAERLKEEDGHELLTLGDWARSKDVLARLSLRRGNEDLWRDVLRAYRAIYEATRNRGEPPSPQTLKAIGDRLDAEWEKLDEESRFPWPIRALHR